MSVLFVCHPKYTTCQKAQAWLDLGMLYRSMALADKLPSMGTDEMVELPSDGMLVKRPLLAAGEKVLVGFKEAEREQALL